MAAVPISKQGVSDAEPHEQLIGKYWQRAYRFAAMATRNDQESADVAQDALLKVLSLLDRFDPNRGSFESWLWQIVLNVARDAGRAAGRRHSLTERVLAFARDEPAGNPEAVALRHLNDREILEAVRRLPKRARTVIALRFGAQLAYREIGDQLGISEAAAVMATRRALDVLRNQINSKEAL